ncbi:MAG: hypothetical protein FD189_2019 [Elusimicrobia bacterium]|nr:MAG: hypothetical protein FD154_2117 [Elusimicrobiota bacterium]KAF0154205.1 MAG: hypothetical protein FD189_2019 [Elusimicrobiota bacterium]
MDSKKVFLTIAAAALALQSAPCAAGAGRHLPQSVPGALRPAGGEYFSAAKSIAEAARAGGFKRIAVLDFAVSGPASSAEARYISEKLSHYLSGSKGLEIIERTLLERVLGEQRLRASAGHGAGALAGTGGAAASVFSVDAVVTGTLFSDELSQSVMTKLLEVGTGRVLASFEIKTEKRWDLTPDMERLPALPDFYAAPADLRDAPAAPAFAACSERRRALADANRGLLAVKAGYWARKMREPGFDRRRLTLNPGSELGDRELKKEFYSLLRRYYDAETPPALSEREIRELTALMKREKQMLDECGVI